MKNVKLFENIWGNPEFPQPFVVGNIYEFRGFVIFEILVVFLVGMVPVGDFQHPRCIHKRETTQNICCPLCFERRGISENFLENIQGFDERGESASKFFRKGLIDEWKNEVPKNIINIIEKKYNKEMIDLGYL